MLIFSLHYLNLTTDSRNSQQCLISSCKHFQKRDDVRQIRNQGWGEYTNPEYEYEYEYFA